MPVQFRVPRVSLFLMHWHFFLLMVTGFNWRFFVSKEESMLGSNLPRIHLAFVIMGTLIYAFLASVFMFWPYRFGNYMLPKSRRNKLFLGAFLVYFVHVLPCWIVEFSIVWNYGWHTVIQAVSFVYLTVSWIIETLSVWYGYTWHMAGFMNANYGMTRFGRGGL